jgi:hypothetical protein
VEETHNFVANGIIAHNTYLGAQAERTDDTWPLQVEEGTAAERVEDVLRNLEQASRSQ